MYYTNTSEIYLDGIYLSRRINSPIDIQFDSSSVHNSISFSCSDPDLFDYFSPELNKGEQRLQAVIDGDTFSFIIDTREGEKNSYNVIGISPSVLYDFPYSDVIDSYAMSGEKLASEIAYDLCRAEWNAVDWALPIDFTFSGSPLDGLIALASEIDAVVRCKPNGVLTVRRKRYPRPADLPIYRADVDYERSTIIGLSHSSEKESGYNAVKVNGRTKEGFLPKLELEEFEDRHSPIIGETVFVRVFWGNHTPNVIDKYITDGKLEVVANGALFEEVLEERVEFHDGVSSVGYPIDSLISYAWIGDAGSPITFIVEDTDTHLSIGEGEYRVADIKYRVKFQRYMVSLHDVSVLIAVIYLSSLTDVRVIVRTEDDVVYGPDLDASYLTTENAAVEKGMAWIDENKYRKENLSISAPYSPDAIDGAIAYINDYMISAQGNYYIKSSHIIINGPQVTNTLELEQCLI